MSTIQQAYPNKEKINKLLPVNHIVQPRNPWACPITSPLFVRVTCPFWNRTFVALWTLLSELEADADAIFLII